MAQSTRPKPPLPRPSPKGAPPGVPATPGASRRPAPGTSPRGAGPARPGGPSWPTWGGGLSRADRDRAGERVAVGALSAIIILSIALVGGALLWDQVIFPQRPVARLDGRPISLRTFTDVLAYRQNVLMAQYQQAQQLAFQPTRVPGAGEAGGDADFLRQFAQQRLNMIQQQLSNLNTQLVDDLIEEQLVRAEATRRGITVTPAELDAELKTLIGFQDPAATPVATPAGTAEPVAGAQAGAQEGDAATTPATPASTPVPGRTTVPAARQTRSFDALFRDYRRATAGTDAVIRADVEYQKLRQKLGDQLAATITPQAEQVHARHILVPDETAAGAVLERLKNGESFEALAAELSIDPGTKDKGGDLGWFPHGFMISDFEEAAFKLQPGEVSDPIKTSFGVHIIRVDEREANRDLEPDQLQALKSNALPRWLDTEKANHKVENLLTPEMVEWSARHARQPAGPVGS